MYNDSTYLPVRSIANLLNMSIDWKNATETTAAQISLTNDLSDEQRNDNLYSIEISAKTQNSKFYSGDTYLKAFNFVGYIDGKWKYMNGVSEIPDSIRDNLNVDDLKK